ncbi:MAG: hypothetical protein WDN67_02530 [Candidatus Moraniibacteriota bacterium]
MLNKLADKIAHIQTQPENVRIRYLVICLGVSMLFIVSIWILTLKENLHSISQTKAQIEELNPKSSEGGSLQDLLRSKEPLKDGSGASSQSSLQAELKGGQKSDASGEALPPEPLQ